MYIKVLFQLIWIFFIFRITSYINLDNNIFQFNFKYYFKFFQDSLSVFILVGLSIYSLLKMINKKIHVSIILIIYPICALIGYFENGIKNNYQDFILVHHFITLSSVFLFVAAIQADKIFDYKFKEILLKIILIFIFLFFLLNILPDILMKLLFIKDIRFSNKFIISMFGSQFEIIQNVNGSARIMFILQVVCLILFKKFILKKKLLSYTYFSLSLFLGTLIYLLQSRFNIIASFLFICFLIFNVKNINLKEKIIFFLILVFVPIFIFDKTFKNNDNRFEFKYSVPPYEFNAYDFSGADSLFKDFEIILNDKQSLFKDFEIILNDKQSLFKEFEIILNDKQSFIPYNIKVDIERNHLSLVSLINEKNIFLKKEFLIYSDSLKNIKQKYDYLPDTEIKIIIKRIIEASNKFIKSYEYIKLNVCSPTLKPLDNILSGRLCGWYILLDDIQKKDLLFGKGFFADQVYLKTIEKVSSNSWVNILYNAGVISLLLCLTFLTFFFLKFFKIKNINHKNFFISLSHYLIIYFIFRSAFEDTLAFVSIDLLCALICLLIIKENLKKNVSR